MRLPQFRVRRPDGALRSTGIGNVPVSFALALAKRVDGRQCAVSRLATDSQGNPSAVEWGIIDCDCVDWLAGPLVSPIASVAKAVQAGIEVAAVFPTMTGFAIGGSFKSKAECIVFEALPNTPWRIEKMAHLPPSMQQSLSLLRELQASLGVPQVTHTPKRSRKPSTSEVD
jgi:hypothetical protein